MNYGWGMTFPCSIEQVEHISKLEPTIVRFHSSVATYILEGVNRHHAAKIYFCEDKSGDVFFEIKLLDLWDFKHWVRSFDSKARFISPKPLVEEELHDIKASLKNYAVE